MILYIANRGEIARRITRTAKRLGIVTVVGYADSDVDLPFVEEADEAFGLNGEMAEETYLDMEKVIDTAKKLKATHLHPGYGFLAENADFAQTVEEQGLQFVGPSFETLRLLGDKSRSRQFLKKLKIPLLSSYDGEDQSIETLLKEAKKIGFPLLIKPSLGGGGKGIVRVNKYEHFPDALSSSRRIARSAFSDDRVLLEKYMEPARHIEVQILADRSGAVEVLGERECSLQRRHQKIIEECPCIGISNELRKKLYLDSKKIAQKSKYYSAGTVEWIWDGQEGLYFLEMNTRLQVEHPVTELVYGLDIVEWQLRIAKGEKLNLGMLYPRGHAIEARLCAENPSEDFIPSVGKIHRLHLPTNVRVDFGYRESNTVTSYFDSLMGKLISHGKDRSQALKELKKGLEQTLVFGPITNRAYLLQILSDPRVERGELSTKLVEETPYHFNFSKSFDLLNNISEPSPEEEEDDLDYFSPWGGIARAHSAIWWEDFEDKRYFHTAFADWYAQRPRKDIKGKEKISDHMKLMKELRSPLPSRVNKVNTKAGLRVKEGEILITIEAMKMEHQLKAPKTTKIKKVYVKEGQQVDLDQILVDFED